MMDIIKQLKKAALFDSTGLFMGAAEEIERLNKRIETLQEVVRDQTSYGVEELKENDRMKELLQNWMGCCFVDFVKEDVTFGMGVKKVWAETHAFLQKKDSLQ
jgi:hypothetical protein